MEIFDARKTRGKAEGYLRKHVVIRHILAVAASCLGRKIHGLCKTPVTGKLRYVIDYSVFVKEGLLRKASVLIFNGKLKFKTRIYNGLTVQHIREILNGDIYIGKHLDIRLPTDDRTGAFFFSFKRSFAKLTDGKALFEVHFPDHSAVIGLNLHILGCILRCASSETVGAEGVFIVGIIGVVVILTARVKLAEHKVPVIFTLLFVISERNAAASVIHLNGLIAEHGNTDKLTVAGARLVDGVG